MAQHLTVTAIVQEVNPPETYTYVGACASSKPYTWAAVYGPAPPPVSSFSNTPVEISMSKSDPTKGPGRNWSRIKRSGEISFTPYSVSKTITENFVINTPHKFSVWTRRTAACETKCVFNAGEVKVSTSYQQSHHIGVLGSKSGLGNAYRLKQQDFEEQIRVAISTTQQAAYARALSTFDLLTTLAEGKETLTYMQSVVGGAAKALSKFAQTDETTYKRARGMNAKQLLKSSDKKLRRLGSRWMEYRYAIMPLIFTIKDINALLGGKDAVYQSGRDRADVNVRVSLDDIEIPLDKVITYGWGSLDAKVSSTFKARYDSGALQRVIAQTGFNPFLTAWELVPYSFVVDWFLNVGDAITAATISDFSSQSLGCTAIKRNLVYCVNHYDHSQDYSSRAASTYYDATFPLVEDVFQRRVDALVQRVATESYDRIVYTKPQPKIHFDPYLDWKRGLDGLVLSYQPIKKLLRSL